MKINRILAPLFVILSFVAVILDDRCAIQASLASVTYAILSLKE